MSYSATTKNQIAQADSLLDTFEFGSDIEIVAQDAWDTSDPDDFIKVLYAIDLDKCTPDDDETYDSFRISFHVNFEKGEAIEAYAYDVATGSEIGEQV